MDGFIRLVGWLSRACGVLATALIALSVLVVCQMVFVRFVLNQPSIWQTEFTIFCLIGATLLGSPYVLLTKGHVNVDLLSIYLGRRARFWLELASAAVSLAFCLLIAVLGYTFWHEAWAGGWRTSSIWRAPLWIPYFALPVGMGVLSLQYVADILSLVTGRAQPSRVGHGEPA
jgi:TRAP-type C4-dicarboxylate transport system permease small subunit